MRPPPTGLWLTMMTLAAACRHTTYPPPSPTAPLRPAVDVYVASRAASSAGGQLEIEAPPPVPTPAGDCHAIENDPEWLAVQALSGKPIRDEQLCARRRKCCRVLEKLTSPARRVVQLELLPHDDKGTCTWDGPHGDTEYWLVEGGPRDVARKVRLLVVSQYRAYAPDRGALESSETFVWSHQDTCYGYAPGHHCAPAWRTTGRIALVPEPHLLEGSEERTCEGVLPFMINVHW